jgi:hypothetical protein
MLELYREVYCGWNVKHFRLTLTDIRWCGRLAAPPDVGIDAPRRREVGICALLVALFCLGEAALKEPPKRDFKVEPGPLTKTKLRSVDPKFIANKFYADFRLAKRSQVDVTYDPRHIERGPKSELTNVQRLVLLDSGNRLVSGPSSDRGDRGGFDTFPPVASEIFKFIADQCPSAQRPSLLDYLTSAECDRDSHYGRSVGPYNDLAIGIFAPTAEEAEARAIAILRLFDCGLSRPLQRHFIAEAQKYAAEAREKYRDYAKLSEAIHAEEEKIAKPSEISAEILGQLKAQKVMMAVEMAGLNARVKACDAMLNEPKKLEVSALQSVSDMKVKAEIERIGIKEKLDQINAFIAEGDHREATQKSIATLDRKRSIVARDVSSSIDRAESCVAVVGYYAPRELIDNKITISPVEWTQ